MIRRLKTRCCPDAGGREPEPGEQKWTLSFPLEGGDDYLELEVGRRGRDALLAMLAQEEADDAAEEAAAQGRRPAEVFHPSVFIGEEMEARGWGLDDLAARMGPPLDVNRLAVELYLVVGPTEPRLLLGDSVAAALAVAFGTSPELFANLERAWLEWIARQQQAREG